MVGGYSVSAVAASRLMVGGFHVSLTDCDTIRGSQSVVDGAPASLKIGVFTITDRASPCGPHPPSYMRLTVAISRVFDIWGSG
jgi:hypothetical protein